MEPIDLDELSDVVDDLIRAAEPLTQDHPRAPDPDEIDAGELSEMRELVDHLAGALDECRETWTRVSRRLHRYVGRFEEVLEEAELLLDEANGADP